MTAENDFTNNCNPQWSVTALSDACTGSVVERYTYDHFGKRTILEPNGTTVRATSSYAMPFGYTSRQHDTETGLMYFRARYYDPATSEFTSPDPLEYVDGMSLFRGYFGLKFVDPSGLECEKKCSIEEFSIKREEARLRDIGRPSPNGGKMIGYQAKVEVNITFNSPCNCCEYRQWVLQSTESVTIIQADGTRDPVHHVVEDLGEGKEDCVVDALGRRFCYGHKTLPKEEKNSVYSPDGCKYTGIDYMGAENVFPNVTKIRPGQKLEFSFSIRLLHLVIDICNGHKIVASEFTDSRGTGIFSADDFGKNGEIK